MGYMAHNVIIVTSWKKEHVAEAYGKATSLFNKELITPTVETKLNGYYSFFIATDGSKEGWEDSNNGNAAREAFLNWCQSSGLFLDAIDVRYGGDEPELARIERIVL